ncbi:TonB family protein [Kordiimonas sp.]|uniref:TonB family protein n=1 Tax=Kordiimonas sp. TaxID=1970157 RepID=UPI003A915E1B
MPLVISAVAFPVVAGDPATGEKAWSEEIRSEFAKVSHYPGRAAKMGIEGTVKVRVDMNSDGTVTRYDVVQSSGSNLLDNAARRMMRDLRRLPALEDGADKRSFVLPLSFRLADKVKVEGRAKKDALTAWRDNVRRRVASNVSYPASLVDQGVEGRVTVRLTVRADGTVAGQQIAQSSGHEALDAEALRVTGRLGKLPNLPAGQEPGELVLPVVYKIAENR